MVVRVSRARWITPSGTRVPYPYHGSAPNGMVLVDTHGGTGQTYNLIWTSDISLKDGEIEVDVRANSGEEDQGGGPMWRVLDANNYYVVRYNPLGHNFSLYVVELGRVPLQKPRQPGLEAGVLRTSETGQ